MQITSRGYLQRRKRMPFNMIGSLVDTFSQAGTNRDNLALQREQYEYSKEMQQKVWDREDNSIQRLMQQGKDNNINPYALLGMNSTSQTVTPTAMQGVEAPKLNMKAEGVLSMLQQKQNIETTEIDQMRQMQEIKNLKAQEINTLNNVDKDKAQREYNKTYGRNPNDTQTPDLEGVVVGEIRKTMETGIKAGKNNANNWYKDKKEQLSNWWNK